MFQISRPQDETVVAVYEPTVGYSPEYSIISLARW